jgi:hypothetical protein
MILALECDYCDDSESYRQIQFGNANNLRLMLSSRLRPLSRANAIIRPSMANRWPRLRIQFSNHDRIFSKRISTIFMPLALDEVPVCCAPVTFHPTGAALFRLGALLTD